MLSEQPFLPGICWLRVEGQSTGWGQVSFVPFLPGSSATPLGVGATLPFWTLLQADVWRDPSPGLPLLLVQQLAGLGEWMGFACPSQVRKPRHTAREGGGSKIRPGPGNGGLPSLTGLLVFLFSKLVCHRGGRGRPFRLGPSPTWPGHSSSFTLERTAADLDSHRVPHAPSSNTTLSLGPRVLLLENPPLSPRCSSRGIHIRTPLFCWVDFFQENACVG